MRVLEVGGIYFGVFGLSVIGVPNKAGKNAGKGLEGFQECIVIVYLQIIQRSIPRRCSRHAAVCSPKTPRPRLPSITHLQKQIQDRLSGLLPL